MNHFKVSTILALLGVVLGAFGAHGLEDKLAASGLSKTWDTAAFYHLVHAVALFALSLSPLGKQMKWPGNLFIIGILIFSGSLYTLCLTEIKVLGAITPIGGLSFIAAWGMLAFVKQK
ncbi:DUF423 domain-containing protein [Puniceicoccaceae bacterium K14]|nr:DUF423 domain-containing protein [Puniceicoccaceae bacterium K14]